jgi:hypothetical protein
MSEEEPVVAPEAAVEEAAPEPAPAKEAAAEPEEEKKDEKPKEDATNGKSYEERLAELTKPDPVPNPDQDAVNNKLSSLNAQIEKCDKRLVRLAPRARVHVGMPRRPGVRGVPPLLPRHD